MLYGCGFVVIQLQYMNYIVFICVRPTLESKTKIPFEIAIFLDNYCDQNWSFHTMQLRSMRFWHNVKWIYASVWIALFWVEKRATAIEISVAHSKVSYSIRLELKSFWFRGNVVFSDRQHHLTVEVGVFFSFGSFFYLPKQLYFVEVSFIQISFVWIEYLRS